VAVCLDASVLVAAVLPEELTSAAQHLLERCEEHDERLVGPTLTLYEVASALRRKAFDGETSEDEAFDALNLILGLRVHYYRHADVHREAYRYASSFGQRHTYDEHYLAVAVATGSDLWSGDSDFVRRAQTVYARCHSLEDLGSAE
jgi:predicted nucleic acid-binding protein